MTSREWFCVKCGATLALRVIETTSPAMLGIPEIFLPANTCTRFPHRWVERKVARKRGTK